MNDNKMMAYTTLKDLGTLIDAENPTGSNKTLRYATLGDIEEVLTHKREIVKADKMLSFVTLSEAEDFLEKLNCRFEMKVTALLLLMSCVAVQDKGDYLEEEPKISAEHEC